MKNRLESSNFEITDFLITSSDEAMQTWKNKKNESWIILKNKKLKNTVISCTVGLGSSYINKNQLEESQKDIKPEEKKDKDNTKSEIKDI